jgi:hypothetical protein
MWSAYNRTDDCPGKMERNIRFRSIGGAGARKSSRINPEQIEGVEHRVAAPAAPEEVVELRTAFSVQNDDLTAEHGLALQIEWIANQSGSGDLWHAQFRSSRPSRDRTY